ncbi:hypothetical protein QQP08_012465 [Theobroma cacao]|nr:hypothetical protein QQP08_012465 [Theobroma cacao]
MVQVIGSGTDKDRIPGIDIALNDGDKLCWSWGACHQNSWSCPRPYQLLFPWFWSHIYWRYLFVLAYHAASFWKEPLSR